jgi:hypothetical protein
MISKACLALGVWLALVPSVARADAYVWGGAIGQVSVHVSVAGFAEGAGAAGWEPASARWFVAWAHTLETMLPPGTRAEVGNDEPDEPIALRLVTGSSVVAIDTGLARAFPGELDPVLALVAAHFGIAVPSVTSASPLTIQVFAARDAARAARFADAMRLETSTTFYEACAPCADPPARVLDEGALHRVVVGVYVDRAHARRALSRLRVPGAFVRRL